MRSIRHHTLTILPILSTILLTSCTQFPKTDFYRVKVAQTQAEAGSVQISPIFVAPWDEYVDRLQVRFELSAADAQNAVLAHTLRNDERSLDARQFGAALALPQTTTSETATTTTVGDADPQTPDEVSREIQRVEQRSPGDPSALSPAAPIFGERTAAGLPGQSLFTSATGIDARLRYQAATALFQEVRILNHYLEDAALRYEHEPYIVRLQVNVMPAARHQPYDVHTRLSFFSGAAGEQAPAPFVIPLLAPDNLEAAALSRSAEELRQLTLGLGLMFEGAGGKFDYNKFQNRLQSVFGQSLNSLMSVARASDNSLHVRIGAVNDPRSRLAMIPRNHYVTFLLLVPKKYTEPQNQTPRKNPTIRVTSVTSMVHGLNGEVLPRRRPERDLEDRAHEIFEPLIGTDPQKSLAIAKVLVSFIQGNQYEEFLNAIQNSSLNTEQKSKLLGYSEYLWTVLLELMQEARAQAASFALPPQRGFAVDPGQSIVIDDDGKAKSVIALSNSRGLLEDRISAVLEVGSVKLAARSVDVSTGGRSLALTFPSLKKFELRPKCGEPAEPPKGPSGSVENPKPPPPAAPVTLNICQSASLWEGDAEECVTLRDSCLYQITPPTAAPKDPRFDVISASGLVIADQEGTGRLKLTVKFDEKDKKQLIKHAEIVLTGADTKSVVGTTAGSFTFVGQTYKVTKATTLTLELENLHPGKQIKITAKSDAGVAHDTLNLPIHAAKKTP